MDVKWEVRSGLVLDGTVNPDFAQVEADEQFVNLTRFDLFLPEEREFFLENAGVFEFGTRGFFEPPPFLLFFSRQIGIEEDEGEVPVMGGVRPSGRVGKQTVRPGGGRETRPTVSGPSTARAVASRRRSTWRSGPTRRRGWAS